MNEGIPRHSLRLAGCPRGRGANVSEGTQTTCDVGNGGIEIKKEVLR